MKPGEIAAEVPAPPDEVDLPAGLYEEAAGILCRYLAIPTENPPGDESGAVTFLAEILRSEGFEETDRAPRSLERKCYRIYETAPGRKALLARIPGRDRGDLVFMNHMDVVPAYPSEWEVGPYSGEIRDGYIWGRGALDMKGQAVQQLAVFLHLGRSGRRLRKGLSFLALPDEEATGLRGAKPFAERWLEDLDPELILSEGGFGLRGMMHPGITFPIDVAEKTSIRFRLTARGKGGHGNAPSGDSAVFRLISALSGVRADLFRPRMHPVVVETLRRLAGRKRFPESFLLARAGLPVVRDILFKAFSSDRTLRAMTRNTVNISVLSAGKAPNGIPASAEAVVDIRILPGEEPGPVLERFRAALGSAGKYLETEFLTEPAQAASTGWDHPGFQALESALTAECPDALITPLLDIGGSDMAHFRRKGVPCFGIVPVIISPEELSLVHNANERISLDNLGFGIRVLYRTAVMLVCGSDRAGA